MIKRIPKRTYAIIALFISFTAHAYETEELPQYQEKYSEHQAVVLNHRQIISLEVDDQTGELVIYETDYEEVLYLKETTKYYTARSISTSEFFEDIMEIKVTVFDARGKKNKLKDDDFKIVDSPPSSWVFHDDDKEWEFDLGELGEGYRTVIVYKKRLKRPQFFDAFHFMSGYPVLASSVEIEYPNGTQMKYYDQNLDNYEVKKNRLEGGKNDRIKESWKIENLEAYKTEDGSIDPKYSIPHLVAQIVSYPHNGENKRIIGTAEELHSFFQEFLLMSEEAEESRSNGAKEDGNKETHELVDELIKNKETQLEKMDTIFSWVQANIKYIAFEDGINGYVPRSCREVMSNRYGDCKDMGNLLVEMLTYAGVENAYVAWVGTREIPYLMSEIPTPLACNHVICVVKKNDDDYYFLDATHAQGSYLRAPHNVQGKDLLIHKGLDQFELFKVEPEDAESNYLRSVVTYELDGDSLRGSGTDHYGGYERERRTYYLKNTDDEDRYDYVKNITLAGFNRYTLHEFEIENLDKFQEDLIVHYHFAVDNLFLEYDGDFMLNPTLFKPRITQYNEEDHSMARYKRHHRTVDYSFQFKIPEDFELKHLPEDVSYEHELFSFLADFEVEGQWLKVQMKYQYHLLSIPTELYPEWKELSEAINTATIQNVVFRKKQI